MIIYGMNALFIFAFSGLVSKMLGLIEVGGVPLAQGLYAQVSALEVSPVNSSLLYALLFNAAMFLLAWWMWRRKWFVKV
ncbi:hypothetical protein BN2497_7151 [Janthinobacterium sp. CG23_2]|nr:hypothetical protein BN2497_7151 [Janthinobacterium sp. CG23_2]CUU29973.1 hypothetical protein BN3177_7151 [Janthinobacterium sp. CG23_2]